MEIASGQGLVDGLAGLVPGQAHGEGQAVMQENLLVKESDGRALGHAQAVQDALDALLEIGVDPGADEFGFHGGPSCGGVSGL